MPREFRVEYVNSRNVSSVYERRKVRKSSSPVQLFAHTHTHTWQSHMHARMRAYYAMAVNTNS